LKDDYTSYHNLRKWEERKLLLLSSISQKTGIDFKKPARPIDCIETKTFDTGDCTVKNVFWKTLDNYYVAGNIYLPKNTDNPIPAVMLPHGHFEHDRFNNDSTVFAVSLAKLGCMVVTYDMVGRGEDKETPHEDKYNNAIQLHNSIRILDFIYSLDYIDKKRIAITGASGGGTQTMMLGAVDSRVKVSIPVCMTSAHFNGGCKCESGMEYFEGKNYKTNTAEIAAMFAPKGMLVISIGTDWTKNTPKVEFPYLQKVYGFYDAAGKVQNAHFAKEEHNYGPSKRKACVAFLAEVFGLYFSLYNENEGELPDKEALKSYTPDSLRPLDALMEPEKIYNNLLGYYAE
jgi:uncharacterized protein